MTSVDELSVVLRGDSVDYNNAMKRSVDLLVTMEGVAAKTSSKLEQISKAWAQPQSQEDFLRNEMALRETVAAASQENEKQMLRERLRAMEVAADKEAEASEKSEADARAVNQDFLAWRMLENSATQQAAQAAQQAAQQTAETREGYEARYFALTHTAYETRMRELQTEYQRRITLHGADARSRMLIEQIHNVEVTRLREQEDAAQRRQLFQRRGLLMMSARQVASASALMGGGQVGMLGAMLSSGTTLATGGAMAGVIAVGMAVSTLIKSIKEAKEIQKQWNKEIDKSAEGWGNVASGMLPTTEFGGIANQRLEEYRNQIKQTAEQLEDVQKRSRLFGLVGGGSLDKLKEKQQYQQEQADLLASMSFEEMGRKRESGRIGGGFASSLIDAEGMRTGWDKEKAVLAAQSTAERHQIEERIAERKFAFDQARAMEEAERSKRPQDVTENFAWEQKKALGLKVLREQAARDIAEFEARDRNKKQALERKHAEELQRDKYSATDAHIQLTEKGYERERSLLTEKQNRERAEYFLAGRDQTYLKKKQDDELLAFDQKQAEDSVNILVGMNRQTAVLRHQMTATAAEWAEKEQGYIEQGWSQAKIDAYHAAYTRFAKARAEAPYADAMASLNDQLDLAIGNITELEAAYRGLRRSNEDLTDAQLRAQAALQQKTQLAQFAKGEREKMVPAEGLKDYWKQIKDAMDAGVMDSAMGAALMRQRMFDATAIKNTGTFQTLDARNVDIKALGIGRAEDTTSKLLGDTNSFLSSIDARIAEQIRLQEQGLG